MNIRRGKSLAIFYVHNLVVYIRNMKKVSFKKRLAIIFLLFALPVIIFYVCTNSKFVCVELFLKSQVNNVCEKYSAGEVVGDFCPALCFSEEVTDFKCLSRTSGQSTFLARWKNRYIIVKSSAQLPENQFVEPLTWRDIHGDVFYPTDDEFRRMMQRAAFFRYNMSLPLDKIHAMTKFTKDKNRVIQMDDMWRLTQQNDYFMGTVFASQEIFPEVLGTCGPLYALEHLKPLIPETGNGIMTVSDWKSRIKAAVLILDYLKELDSNQDPVKLCDMKFSSFGISENKLMKYNDLKSIYVRSYLDYMIGNGRTCLRDSHCNQQQCKSVCDLRSQKCLDKQLNNNLQILCDKIFQGTPHWPGLLSSNRAPKSLRDILDECSNPQYYKGHDQHRPFAASTETRDRLYDELTRIYEEVISSQHNNM